MKVLFITRHYLDQSNGGAKEARAALDAFSSIYDDITLLYPEHNGLVVQNIVQSHVRLVPSYDYRSKIRKGIEVYKGRVHRFAKDLRLLLSKNGQYDLIVFDHSVLGAELIDIIKSYSPSSVLITIHCNVEKQYNKDNPVSWLYRIPFTHYIEKAEVDCLKNSKLNITLTLEDLLYFRSNYSVNPESLEYLGTFEYIGMEKVYDTHSTIESNVPILVISGSLDFPQSSDAVIEFLERYYPIAKDVNHKMRLIITGRNPSDKIRKLCSNDKSIILVPSPEDINTVIKKGNIYCSPVSGGSGVKLRVMDGLKLGLPVLCHQVSAKGYEIMVEKGCMFTYHDEETFLKSFLNILKDRPDSDKVYSTYINRFGFEAGCKRLRAILSKHGLI